MYTFTVDKYQLTELKKIKKLTVLLNMQYRSCFKLISYRR